MTDFDPVKAFESRQAEKKRKAENHNNARDAKKRLVQSTLEEHLSQLEQYAEGEVELTDAQAGHLMDEAQRLQNELRVL